MEQFSKFIRPGWVAVGESDDNNGLRISAFKNPATGDFASVIVNTGSSAITETINLNGAYAPVITPWVTTATLDVAQQQSIPATGDGSSFTYTIPAKSIVTLTGTATTTPVTEAPVGLLSTGATTSTITLSWTNNLISATGYTVQRSSDGTNWTTLSNTVPSGTYTYTDSGLPANTLFYLPRPGQQWHTPFEYRGSNDAAAGAIESHGKLQCIDSERNLELDTQRLLDHRLCGRCFHRRRQYVDDSIRRYFFEFIKLHRHHRSRTCHAAIPRPRRVRVELFGADQCCRSDVDGLESAIRPERISERQISGSQVDR